MNPPKFTNEELASWDWEGKTAKELALEKGVSLDLVYKSGSRIGRKPVALKRGYRPQRDWSKEDLSGVTIEVAKRFGISGQYVTELRRRYKGEGDTS